MAAQANQTIIDQISIIPPEFMRFLEHNAGIGGGKRSLISTKCQWFKWLWCLEDAAILPHGSGHPIRVVEAARIAERHDQRALCDGHQSGPPRSF